MPRGLIDALAVSNALAAAGRPLTLDELLQACAPEAHVALAQHVTGVAAQVVTAVRQAMDQCLAREDEGADGEMVYMADTPWARMAREAAALRAELRETRTQNAELRRLLLERTVPIRKEGR